jgi:hypothetical protein
LRLDRHIGVSVSSLRKIQTQMERQIINYQEQQQQQYRKREVADLEICAAVDETFFEQAVLVLMDLASGFIVLEHISDDYSYDTWKHQASQALAQWGLQVRYCVSDRAPALIKLAREAWNCPSLADLFHALHDLSKGLGPAWSRPLKHLQKRLAQLAKMPDQTELQAELETQVNHLQTAQATYPQVLHQITTRLHPFAITTGQAQTTRQAQTQLQTQIERLQQLQQLASLATPTDCIDQFAQRRTDLTAGIDLWWDWVHQDLQTHHPSPTLAHWLQHTLLPAQYWTAQAQRTQNPCLKLTYQQAAALAHKALQTHAFTLTHAQFAHWQAWANAMVTKYQRASSAVEGRNGYLSAVHHNRRGLSQSRLQAMTTIHNFYLKRPDGTTAAERLFGSPPPDLFDWLVQHMPDLPAPRQRKSTTKSKTPVLQAVPA